MSGKETSAFGGFKSFSSYAEAVKHASNTSFLTQEEEIELIRRAQEEGDGDAKLRIIEAHLGLVLKYVSRYKSASDVGEMIDAGRLAMLEVIERFDPSLGFRFNSFARHHIQDAVSTQFWDSGAIARRKQLRQIRQEVFRARAQQDAREASARDLGQSSGVSTAPTDTVTEAPEYPVGFDMGALIMTPAFDVYFDVDKHDVYLSERRDDRPDYVADEQETRRLQEQLFALVLSELPEREAYIMRTRVLSKERKKPTLGQVGEYFGLSRERIRQIEAQSIERFSDLLRKKMDERGLEASDLLSGVDA